MVAASIDCEAIPTVVRPYLHHRGQCRNCPTGDWPRGHRYSREAGLLSFILNVMTAGGPFRNSYMRKHGSDYKSATTVLMAWTLLRGGSCTITLLWPNAEQPFCHSRSCVDQATLEADTLSCVKQASPWQSSWSASNPLPQSLLVPTPPCWAQGIDGLYKELTQSTASAMTLFEQLCSTTVLQIPAHALRPM
ncbi:hypothetical protein HaLaN_20221, partial [Haematococcus lacustris]